MTCAARTPAGGTSTTDVEALVLSCSQATLGQVESCADELGRAGSLLSDAMAVLRRSFGAALAAHAQVTDRGECQRNLEAAMVALQCEDALVQMLGSMQRRTLQMADALRHVAAPERGGNPSTTGPLASRLRLAATMLDTGIARSGPVTQKKAVVGTVDLF